MKKAFQAIAEELTDCILEDDDFRGTPRFLALSLIRAALEYLPSEWPDDFTVGDLWRDVARCKVCDQLTTPEKAHATNHGGVLCASCLETAMDS